MQITTGQVATYTVDGETLQAVPWQITDETGMLSEGSQSFPLTATADEIKAFLAQTLDVYEADAQRFVTASAHQADLDAAAQVADEVSNITISAS